MSTDDDDSRFGITEPSLELPANRITKRPPASDPKDEHLTPQQMKNIIQEVGTKLDAIDVKLLELQSDVGELHALLLGMPHPSVIPLKLDRKTKRIGGIGQVFHDWTQHLTVIAGNSETMVRAHEEYANEVARVHQENVRLTFKQRELELEVEKLRLLVQMKLTELPVQLEEG